MEDGEETFRRLGEEDFLDRVEKGGDDENLYKRWRDEVEEAIEREDEEKEQVEKGGVG